MSEPVSSLLNERVLRGANRQLDAIIESLYDGIWIMDGQGIVLNVNHAALNLHNLKAEEIVGKNIQELVAKGIIDRSSTLEVLATKGQVNILQFLTKGGRYLLVTATPIFNEAGEITQVVVTDRDITQLKSLWERLDQTLMLKGDFKNDLSNISALEVKGTRVVAAGEAMRRILGIALRLAQLSVSNILLLGESGTGKGLLAKFIHENSKRKTEPFTQVNCAALPEGLVEAELFGYERGAFTGAKPTGKIGLFELAREGTLFLDEIGELPSAAQAKLLKCVDENEIMPLGGLKTKRIRCSIIAASNRDLEPLVRKGMFREDLFFRLNAFSIRIPPLRERPEDIGELASSLLLTYNKMYKTQKQLSSVALERLKKYRFPGNVRELENLLKNAIVMSDHPMLDKYVLDYIGHAWPNEERPVTEHLRGWDKRLNDELSLAEVSILREALERCKSTREMAKYLDISQATVVRKLKKRGLSPPGKGP
jgi:PAS domain S-box-containing protein